MGGCNAAAGGLDDSKFAEPLPAVGLYVAGASLLCALAIGLDVLRGIRLRRLWFPCRYLSLNSATLTILGIATKFPVDLNTAMPSRTDQLSKLSSTILIFTIMANTAPSLGTMGTPELVSNLIALGILVVTVVVNVCIQMGTGVIYVFLPEHAVVLFFMLHLLVILVLIAITVPEFRDFYSMYIYVLNGNQNTDTSSSTSTSSTTTPELRDPVTKLLLAEDGANTGAELDIGLLNPLFGTSLFGPLGLLILVEAFVRSSLVSEYSSSTFCEGTSEYKWSVPLVLIAQTVAIVMGAVPSASRYYNSDSLSLRVFGASQATTIRRIMETSSPFGHSTMGGRMKHLSFNSLLILLHMSHLVNWLICTVVHLLSRLPIILLSFLPGLVRTRPPTLQNNPEHSGDQMLSIANMDIERWILKGKKRRPTELIELIKERHSRLMGRVLVFHRPTGDDAQECYALAIVALAAIAAALPRVDSASVQSLLAGVRQGLGFARLVDKNLRDPDDPRSKDLRREADKAWYELRISNTLFGRDLRHLVPKGSSRKLVVQKLREIADTGDDLLHRYVKRVTEAILEDYGQPPSDESASSYPFLPRTDDNLFPWLRMTISDVFRACLANLPRAICKECVPSTMAEGRKRAKKLAYMIGQVEDEIIPILHNQEFADLDADGGESMDGIDTMLRFSTPMPTLTVDALSAVIIDQIDDRSASTLCSPSNARCSPPAAN